MLYLANIFLTLSIVTRLRIDPDRNRLIVQDIWKSLKYMGWVQITTGSHRSIPILYGTFQFTHVQARARLQFSLEQPLTQTVRAGALPAQDHAAALTTNQPEPLLIAEAQLAGVPGPRSTQVSPASPVDICLKRFA